MQIIDSKTFTKTEDHEVLIEKKKYELEHRPVEKQVWPVLCCLPFGRQSVSLACNRHSLSY